MIVTLDEAKAHLRVTFDDDDTLILDKLEAAQRHIERLLGYEIDDGSSPLLVPAPLKQAVLELTALWYDSRQPTSDGSIAELPFSVADIVREYRNWSF